MAFKLSANYSKKLGLPNFSSHSFSASVEVESSLQLHHLVKLRNPKIVVTHLPPMSVPQQTRLFRQMEAYLRGLDRRDFIPSPGMQCSSCEFFNECRHWR